MAERAPLPVEPLFLECEAARMIGIEPRALRSERAAGRITYRKVAGRIMYRADDLTAWQENVACRARPKAPSSGQTRKDRERGTSTGPTPRPAVAASIAQGQAIKAELLSISRNGSHAKTAAEAHGPGRVVQLKSR